ncbi:hypothetical protein, partial [Shouchella miscanthi]|nr:hypothetical protein [Shouchella miscanthi]
MKFESKILSLNSIYENDKKILRSGTILFGELPEGTGWHSKIRSGLTHEELNDLEANVYTIQGKMPYSFKIFLGYTNGAYLFDLINICGLDLYEKGMSLEEELQKPRDIADFAKDIMLDKRGPTLLKDYYFFGESFINGTVFAFDKEEKVIEFKEGSLRKIREFN